MKEGSIRKAVDRDAWGLHECMHEAYGRYKEVMNGEYLPPLEVDYQEEIRNYPVWVIESDGKIAGAIIMVFEKEEASIANIAVHPLEQGKGLGRALMEFAEKEAIKRGYQSLHLATHILLTENVAYYKRLGWLQVDQDKKKVYMKKSLR